MSCEVQINTIRTLKKKNVIDDFSENGRNRILNIIEFDKLNNQYTEYAKKKYPNLVLEDGQLLFSVDRVETKDSSRSTYRRDAKYTTYWAVPNKTEFDKLQVEFDKAQEVVNKPDLLDSDGQYRLFQLEANNDLEEAIKGLDDYLLNFLKQFGVRSKEFNDFKSKYGVNALGATDVLNKMIWYSKNKNVETIPEEAAHMLVMLMGETNPTIKELLDNITQWSEYKSIEKEYMPIYNNQKQVRIEAVGKLIAKALVKNYKASGLNKSLLERALKVIDDFLEKLKTYFRGNILAEMESTDRLADHIAINVLMGNVDYVANLKKSNPRLNYEKALKSNTLAQSIISDFTSINAKLTGSLALAGQGETIYRSSEEPIHDIDFVVGGKKDYENILKKVESINGVPYHYGWDNAQKDFTTYAFLLPKKGFTVEVLERDFNRGNGWITKFNLRDSQGRIVLPSAQNVIAVDFFVYKEGKTEEDNYANFASSKNIYKGKLTLSPLGRSERLFRREKDQQDYVLSKPLSGEVSSPEFLYFQTSKDQREDMEMFGIPLIDINIETLKDAKTKQLGDALAKKLSLSLNLGFQNITPEKAAEITRVSPTPYNGEPAFYYAGTVYVVGDNINVNTVLHEFSHPVINAIRIKNRKLFDNLYNALITTDEGKLIQNNVLSKYPELRANKDMLQSEILTYGLQMHAVNNLTGKIQTEGFDSIINKILAAIKQILRNIFGNKEGISNINESTTLEQLGDMLLKDEIDLSEYDVTEDDLIQYGKFVTERANELTKSINSPALEKIINEWFATNKSILDRAKNFKTDKVIKEMLTKSIFGQREGSTNLLPEAVSSLNRFQTITDFGKFSKDELIDQVLDAEEKRIKELDRQARALINSIDKIDVIAENMLKDLGKIYREKNVSARNTIALVNFYKQNSYAWKETIDQFNQILRESGLSMDKNNLFYNVLNKINANLDEVNVIISQIYKKNNIQFYIELTGPMNEFVEDEFKKNLGIAFKNAYKSAPEREAAVESFYNKVISQEDVTQDLEELYKKGVPKDVLTRFLNLYQQMIATPEKIQNALTGHAKDVSWFNRFLESYTSSNDPIVGPLALFIQNQRTEVTNDFMDESGSFLKSLEKLLPMVNFSKLSVTQIQDMVTSEDTILYWDKETGKPIEKKIRTFLHEFGNGYRYAEDILEYNLAEARGTKDQEKIIAARDELKQFRKDYMWQEFVPEFYETDKIYDELIEGYDAITSKRIAMEAYAERQNALDDYNNILNEHDDELSRFENYSSIEAAFRKFKQLSSLVYEDGTPKRDDPSKGIFDLSKAKLLVKVSQAKSKFYEFTPLQKSLETSYNEFVNNLATEGITKDHPDFDKKIKTWKKQNLKIKYDPKYAERRSDIITRINELQSKMNLAFDVAGAYSEINSLIFTYRDELGQPITPELGEEKIKKIQELEQSIIDFRETLDKNSGLSQEERSYLNTLTAMVKKGTDLSDEQKRQMVNLLQRQSQTGLTVTEAAELQNLFAELGELSEKIPTDYYIDALNFHLSRLEKGEVTIEKVEEYINEEEFQELIQKDELLREWFDMNHVVKKRKSDGNTTIIYEVSIANRVTIPIDKNYIIKTEIIDNESGEPIIFEGIPNARHSRYQVRNEFRTIPIGESWDKYVGVYIDNKGNFLPRLYNPGDKNSAKDAKFMNQRFFDLKRSNSSEYKLLEEMKKFHLGVQKGQSNYSKLYLDMPRFAIKAGDFYQAMQRGKIGERFKNFKEWKSQIVGKSTTDFERGYNYDAKNNLVNTDLKGNEITYVPVEGIYNLDLANTDADIITGLFRYGMSIKTQGKLLESLPIVESIVETLEDPANQPKNMEAYSKGIFNVRNLYQNPIIKGAENNRLGQVRSLIEREYRGQVTGSFEESNPRIAKWLDVIQGLSTRASLAVNLPSDLKNQFSGYIQSMIEGIGGEFITAKDYAMAVPWSTQAMLTWASKDAYAVGPGSLSGQMIQRFDPTFTSEDKFGNSVTKSIAKDLANGSWMYANRKFGEMDVAVKLFGSFLHGQKVNQLVGGKQVFIRYVDAFELDKDGLMKLKNGVDVSWDTKSTYHTYVKGQTLKQIADKYNVTVEELKKRNNIESEIQFEEGQEIIIAKSEKFKAFKNKMQGVSRRLFGAYDRFGQPEGNKFIAYRMFFFMRKWFTPMLTNRWGINSKTATWSGGGERYDWSLGRYNKGYYVSAFQTLVRLIKSKGAEMSYMSDQEKADLKRTMGEGLMIIVLSLVASMLLGFDPDDDEKWKKIRARSGAINEENYSTYGFLTNHMLLLVLGIEAETSAFVPLPSIFGVNLGADDYTKMLTSTSTSWYNTVVLYVQIMKDVLNFVTFDEAERYEKDQGPYWWQQKGALKLWKRLFSVVGFTGGSGDPETVLKNFAASSSRYGG